eukprot:scaffold2325_cov105-Isochrysis_galbana.AAC.13
MKAAREVSGQTGLMGQPERESGASTFMGKGGAEETHTPGTQHRHTRALPCQGTRDEGTVAKDARHTATELL